MDPICYHCSYCILALLQHHQKVLLGLCVIHAHCKLIIKFSYPFRMNIFQSTIQHQIHQVVHHLPVFSNVQESLETFSLKYFEIFMLQSAHSLNHILSYLNWRRVRLGVSTQNKSEIDMKHFPS